MEMIVTGVCSVLVAMIEAVAHRDRKKFAKQQETIDHREMLKKKEMLLQLEMQNANIKLTKIIAKKVQDQETNGDVEEAYQAVKDAQDKYYHFINSVVVEELQ